MHDCDSTLSLLSLCLDGLLPGDECHALQKEIATCPTCQQIYQTMLEADVALRAAPTLKPTHDLTPAIMARVRQQSVREKRMVGLSLVVGGMMSLVPTLLVLFGIAVALVTATNPGILQNGVDVIISFVSLLRVLLVAIDMFTSILAPWILPAIAAIISVLFLLLTVGWARRLQPARHPIST